MAKKIRCSECRATENIKPAREYPELAALLEAYHALKASGDALLCPSCSSAVCGDLRGETAYVLPLDLSETAGQSSKDRLN